MSGCGLGATSDLFRERFEHALLSLDDCLKVAVNSPDGLFDTPNSGVGDGAWDDLDLRDFVSQNAFQPAG